MSAADCSETYYKRKGEVYGNQKTANVDKRRMRVGLQLDAKE